MKQILQSLKTGKTILEDVPCPQNNNGSLLIETQNTLVSAGTERMLLEFGKANLIGKIKQQPDKVKMVFDKIKTDGLATTLSAVKSKLEQPIPLGYCNVGRIIENREHIYGLKSGDRVVSNGYHAEIVSVPKNLCAAIPDNVSNDEAVFTVLGAIALQGIRLSQPTLGENYVVIGLGLVGLMAVQLLRANGCRVLAVDLDEHKCKLANSFGAKTVNLANNEDLINIGNQFSNGNGIDAVLITASTKSNEPLHQAATICRKRGRIVLIGVIGNEFSRADFYEKELTFQVSCSYGPGRYDDDYEQKGHDYPLGFVRWTEQRNFEAILDMMSSGVLNVKALISHRFNFSDAISAYSILENEKSTLGIILNYSQEETNKKLNTSVTLQHVAEAKINKPSVAFLGAGNYAARILAPAFRKSNIVLKSIVSFQGINSKLIGKKLGFMQAQTNESLVYNDKDTDIIVIATRHNLHTEQTVKALNANKHVFVEKPLAMNLDELEKVQRAYVIAKTKLLMVGFNRRFAPQIKTIERLLNTEKSSSVFIMTVNAGFIPNTHWTQDPQVGGGRIIGEVCHFIDLLRFLAKSSIIHWQAVSLNTNNRQTDTISINLTFADGSLGMIHYLTNGSKSFAKERLEIFCNGKILQLDNFRKLIGYGWKSFKKQNLRKQNKGQNECVAAFINSIKNRSRAPIAFDELLEVSRVTIGIANSLRK